MKLFTRWDKNDVSVHLISRHLITKMREFFPSVNFCEQKRFWHICDNMNSGPDILYTKVFLSLQLCWYIRKFQVFTFNCIRHISENLNLANETLCRVLRPDQDFPLRQKFYGNTSISKMFLQLQHVYWKYMYIDGYLCTSAEHRRDN